MVIPYSYHSGPKADVWAGVNVCPNCGKEQSSHYCRSRFWVRIAYVFPVFSLTTKRGLYCDECGGFTKLKYGEYHRNCREQVRKMQEDEFPAQVVAFDGAPENLKMGWQIYYLILACLWAALLIFFQINEHEDMNMDVLVHIVFSLFAIFPLCRTAVDFWFANAKRKAYRALNEK